LISIGEPGVASSWLKPGKWSRVVITFGKDARNQRRFTTYVNSKKCVSISAESRGIFARKDDRFSLNAASFLLFSSSNDALMPGGVRIKHLEVRNHCLSAAKVGEQAYANRIWSPWAIAREREEERRRQSMSLQALYKRPPPVWMHPAFLGEFGDAFLEGTGLQGGTVAVSLAMFNLAFSELLSRSTLVDGGDDGASTNSNSYLEGFGQEEMQVLGSVSHVLSTAAELARRYELATKSGAQLVHWMKRYFGTRLRALKEGEVMIVPGGIGQHQIAYLIERETTEAYRFVIVNTDPLQGLEYHPASASVEAPKIKYKTCLVIEDVRSERMLDDAFWSLAFATHVYGGRHSTPEKIYDLLVPFLAERPLEQALAESHNDESLASSSSDADSWWRSPQRSNTAYYRAVLEAVHYLLRRKGLSMRNAKQVAVAVRAQMLEMVDNDLHYMPTVDEADVRIIKLACEQVAYAAVKIGEKHHLASLAILRTTKELVERVEATLSSVEHEQGYSSLAPPDLNLLGQPTAASQADKLPDQAHLQPFMERLWRREDVDGLAGPPNLFPAYVPVDMLQIPQRVTTFAEAVAAIRHCDRLCTLISVQPHCIKNQAFLKVALIEHTFTRVVPVPKPQSAGAAYQSCVWAQPVIYAYQLDVLVLLQRLIEHFASSAFSIQATRSFDAVKIIVPACMAAIADAMMRKIATDIPAELSEVLANGGFGLSTGHFASQSETIEVHAAELNVARTGVLDYFAEQQLQPIMMWEEGLLPQPGTDAFVAQVCRKVAYPLANLPNYIDGSAPLILKNYPEFTCYRDVNFYFKYFLNTDPQAFPPVGNYSQFDAQLQWLFRNGQYIVLAYNNFPLRCKPEPPLTFTHRFPSAATPALLIDADIGAIETEDDILHIKNLPSFGDVIGQHDSELLLSYLTVPYMRIPLVLTFFSTEDRIHALRSTELQKVLDSALFEPGRYQPDHLALREPQEVPTSEKPLLATPYGLLLNELHRSPQLVLQSVIRLLQLALSLDTGTVHSSTVSVILYIVRFVSRVENFVSFLLEHSRGEHESVSAPLRQVQVTAANQQALASGLATIQSLLRGHVFRMLESWSHEAIRQCENKDDDRVVDENTRLVCDIYSHVLVLFRNVTLAQMTCNIASAIMCSFVFLTTRHTWNMALLTIPETEIFEVLQVQRRRLIAWAHSVQQNDLSPVLEATVRVTAGTGVRVPRALSTTIAADGSTIVPDVIDPNTAVDATNAKHLALPTDRRWGYIQGPRSTGRFTVTGPWTLLSGMPRNAIPAIDENTAVMGIEIDLQIVQLTLKSAHLKALSKQIAGKADVRQIFGSVSMQASTVQDAEHREWVHLIGRNHDLQFWKTIDPRPCVQECDREYIPGELEDTENWIVPIFEPVRLKYLVKPFVLPIFLPEQPLSADAHVAYMIGVHPERGGTWKEFYIFRETGVVHAYNVMSHGRRFYRSLEYTSDARYSLRDMQPSIEARDSPWPRWERHGAGHPYQMYPDPTSVVITRSWDLPANLSGGTETFIPSRLLYGIVPCALLNTHQFWQDEGDQLRGYPEDNGAHLILVELTEMHRIECTRLPETTARITRVLRRQVEERAQRDSRLAQRLIESAAGMVEDLATMRFAAGRTMARLLDGAAHGSEDALEGAILSVVAAQTEKMQAAESETADKKPSAPFASLTELEQAIIEELRQLELPDPVDSSLTSKLDAAARHGSKLLDEEELVLLDLLRAPPHSGLHSLARLLVRIENLSYVLAWTRRSGMSLPSAAHPRGEYPVDLVQLPRLKMTFQARTDVRTGELRLYSVDHADLFVSNARDDLTLTLIKGIPHSLLLSNAMGEIQILVPSIRPVRPPIMSSPFTTELVLDRSDTDWQNSLDTCYYLYPVHVSLSFMFSPTLASALYLLLLRFLHRDYDAVFRLVDSIGTDTEFSQEEQHIFDTLGSANNDFHPDAHACRLKIALATIDSPVVCPWDLTKQMSNYVTKLAHVSTTCRLAHREEQQLLEYCICDVSDARFDPRKYTIYEITLVKNRKLYLAALALGSPTAPAYIVPRARDSAWWRYTDLSALDADQSAWDSLTIRYAAPRSLSGVMVLDTAWQFWTQEEDRLGNRFRLGFLFLYNLFTGAIKAKIGVTDCARSLAVLLSELLQDRREQSMLGSILNILARNPHLCELMPKWKDTRRYTGNDIVKGFPDEEEPESPLATLLEAIIPILVDNVPNFRPGPWTLAEGQEAPTIPDPPPTCTVLPEIGREWVMPVLSDFGCDSRPLRAITGDHGALNFTENDIQNFCGRPLAPLGLEQFVVERPRQDSGLPPVSSQLPFDVSHHDQASSHVAVLMIDRLKADMQEFASRTNNGMVKKCAFLLDEALACVFKPSDATPAEAKPEVAETPEVVLTRALSTLSSLIDALIHIRSIDAAYVKNALTRVVELANHVAIASDADADSTMERYSYLLKRYCKQETHLWTEYLFGTLLSSRAHHDLQKLNPYLEASSIELLFDILVATILHANRVGQINRCISGANDLLKLLQRLSALHGMASSARSSMTGSLSDAIIEPSSLSSSSDGSSALAVEEEIRAGLTINSEALAEQLCTGRYYVDCIDGQGRVYDPRFLVFEFTWNILLRQKQVVLVRDLIDNLKNGRSVVKQMLMGQGKTTVVGPLLTLMLGDGQSLVCQIVPPALLEFSRSVMRSTFSSIMHKRIYTLSFDRASKIDRTMYQKLRNATETRGVVISTPTTIKSIELRFLELLDMVNDKTRPRSGELERDAHQLGEVLRLFRQGVLIMDEVDLILHPLKSELNFPVGEKHDLDFHPQRWKLPIHILDAVFYAERRRMAVGFRQSNRAFEILERLRVIIDRGYEVRALQRNPHVVLLNAEWYHSEMKPTMAEWTHLWLEAQHLSGLTKEHAIKYILEGASSEKNTELAEIVNEQLSPSHKKMLNLAHDWLRSFLPHVLQKIDRVTFGLLNAADLEKFIKNTPFMPRSRAKLAIPFVGKDVPSESSEFAHPDVIIGLTILAYRYEGLRVTDFEDMVANLRSTLTKEIGPFSQRKSSQLHARWVREAGGTIKGQMLYQALVAEQQRIEQDQPAASATLEQEAALAEYDESKEVVSLRLLKRSNKEQMNKLFELIRLLPDAIHWYLENFIFPAHMRHQITKLSACGQECGGDMLFRRRIGFSGTPSDLLPLEMGRCGYEKGSDGMMIHTMTSPDIVSYEVVEEGWSVQSLLNRIASAREPHFNALIDTGALITGMSNYEVAAFLLDHGLPWCEGVVFLDEFDRKMILVRATRRVVKLAQCGIVANKRFAFYDQIHTTGMDIQHVLNAKAAMTLGKDMVFRDLAQGAFRMRQIARGQTIHLLVIPEVRDLMGRELRKALPALSASSEAIVPAIVNSEVVGNASPDAVRKVLQDINAWLVINSMRTERVQFNMLQVQNLTNIWKKNAYSTLLGSFESFRLSENENDEIDDPRLVRALAIFSEPIDFSLEAAVPEPIEFQVSLRHRIEQHRHFILDTTEERLANDIVAAVGSNTMLDESMRTLEAEMVQQEEQEKEQQQQQEVEAEIEQEKFLDKAYSREEEAPKPWRFASLAERGAPPFFPASEFHLFHRDPVQFPPYVMFSRNYFDTQWSGDRRIKNVVVVLEWVPSRSALEWRRHSVADALASIDPAYRETFIKAAQLLDIDESGDMNLHELQLAIRSATDRKLDTTELERVFALARDAVSSSSSAATAAVASSPSALTYDQVFALLSSEHFREEQLGRYSVAISLAEAETIRRILHLRLERDVLDRHDTALALRCTTASGCILDRSHGFVEGAAFQTDTAYVSHRFLDSSMFFNEPQLALLVRALQKSTIHERRVFFTRIIGCRRRLARKWDETPLCKVFTITDEFDMLRQRAQTVRIRECIKQRGILLYDAFRLFDIDHNGYVSPAELYGALEWLGVQNLTPGDILDFVRTADLDKDGNISYQEFVEMLKDPDAVAADGDNDDYGAAPGAGDGETDEDMLLALGGAGALRLSQIHLEPKGEDELRELLEQREREQRLREEAELEKERRQDSTVENALEAIAWAEAMSQPGGPNPSVSENEMRFSFTTGAHPYKMQFRGDMAYKVHLGEKYLKLYRLACLILPIPLRGNGGKRINRYSLTMDIKIDELPAPGTLQALFSTAQFCETEALVYINAEGALGGKGAFGLGSTARMRAGTWHLVTISVDTIEGEAITYIDGQVCATIKSQDFFKDCKYAIDSKISLFGSNKTEETRGGNIKFLQLHRFQLGSTVCSKRGRERECVVGWYGDPLIWYRRLRW